MKKRITITVIVLLIFTVLLGGILYWRSLEDDKSQQNDVPSSDVASTEMVTAESETLPQTGEALEQETETETQQMPSEVSETTMIFTGDVLFGNTFLNTYGQNGISGVLSEEMLAELTSADITMINQEFPFSTRGVPMEDKEFTFRANPSYASALLEMGVDIVSLANNHILDYGREALSDTFTTLDENGILYAGAGETKERAKETITIEKNGMTFGFLAASRVIPVENWNIDNQLPGVFTTYDGTALCQAIADAEQRCDYVVVFVHWGVEYDAHPQGYQTYLAKQYIDNGADLVIGSHTHCLQGIEYYNGKPICYSLGNFIFGTSIERTMAVKVTVDHDAKTSIQLIGAKATSGCTTQMTGAEAGQLYQYIEQISTEISVDEAGYVIQE